MNLYLDFLVSLSYFMPFLAASSTQSSKKRYFVVVVVVVVVVGIDFQSQHLSKKKRKVALERISKWEEHI